MGTIFLDEISEMTPKLQSKILRVIQEKQVFRLGGTKLIPFDARLIVATNQNLWEMAETGSFRKDLYYRLNVLELELPPLRSRLEDLPLLFADFLIMLNPSFAPALKDCLPAIKELLASYIWPGNVRELENFTHILVAYWQPNDGSAKLLHLISEHLKIKNLRLNKQQIKPKIINTNQEHTTNSLKSTEIQHIKRTLELCNGNIGRAASMLGIHRSTLWRKIKAIYGDDSA
jgi:propionate catabolism operon transcriptional regulator